MGNMQTTEEGQGETEALGQQVAPVGKPCTQGPSKPKVKQKKKKTKKKKLTEVKGEAHVMLTTEGIEHKHGATARGMGASGEGALAAGKEQEVTEVKGEAHVIPAVEGFGHKHGATARGMGASGEENKAK